MVAKTEETTVDEAAGGEVPEVSVADVLKANREAADKFKAASGLDARIVVNKSTKVKADVGAREEEAFPAKEKEEDDEDDDEKAAPAVAPDEVLKEDTPRHFRCERYPNLVVPDYDVVFVDGWFTTDDPAVIEALGRIPEVVMQDKPED